LVTWLRATLRHGMTYRGLAATVMNSGLDRETSLASTLHAEMFEVGAALVRRARRAGVVVADADEVDVLKMVGAIAWAVQDAPDGSARADRLLTLLVTGLRHAS
jgi:hypothetical protein